MRSFLRYWLILFLVSSLAACGFHLRGPSEITFKSIHIQGNTLVISKDLEKSLSTSNIKMLDTVEGAELLLELVGEESEKRILSLSGQGKVNEYELYYRVHYRTKLAGAETWTQIQTMEARRDFTFSDANIIAKQAEEKHLNNDMQDDVLNGILRRLSALKK